MDSATASRPCVVRWASDEIHDAITGHDDGSVSSSYGERHLLKVQQEQLARLPHIAILAGLLS